MKSSVYVRTTLDVDIGIRPSTRNAIKHVNRGPLVLALVAFLYTVYILHQPKSELHCKCQMKLPVRNCLGLNKMLQQSI